MKPKHYIFLLLTVFILSNGALKAQCFEGVEYKTATQSDNGSISLTFSKSYNNVEITLYDFYASNKNIKVMSKSITVIRGNDEISVFKDLKLSSYILKLEYGDCVQYLGGIEGINFNDK